jgi:hypothetical protein
MSDALGERLELMLRGLAEEAPPGPSAARVMARLARRTLMRWVLALCAIVMFCGVGVGGVWFAGTLSTPDERVTPAPKKYQPAPVSPQLAPMGTPKSEPANDPGEMPPQIVKPRVAPLAAEADHMEMRQTLLDFFTSCGADRVVIMKDGTDQLSFSLNIKSDQSLAQVRADIESLLAHYDRAEITLRNGRLSYSLLASGRP